MQADIDRLKEQLQKDRSTLNERDTSTFAERMREEAGRTIQAAAEDTAQAKKGLGELGQFAVDVGTAGTQMLGDIATGAPMVSMMVRSYGGGSQEAKEKGYTQAQQTALGLASAATEYFSEKLFGGNPVYDSDAGLINKLVGKVTSNESLLKALDSLPADMLSEGLEEVVSDVLEPLAEGVITGNWEKLDVDELCRDGAVGIVLAGLGIGGSKAMNAVLGRGQADTQAATENAVSTENGAQSIFETLDEVVNGKEKATSQEAASVKLKADTSLFDKSVLKDFNKARTKFIEFAQRNFPQKVVNKETGKEIAISRKGLDKFLSGNIPFEKYASGFYIPELISGAHKVASSENYHNKTVDSIPTYEYYDSPIEIEGENCMAHIRVKNTNMGDKYYGHTVSALDNIEIERPTRTAGASDASAWPENTERSTYGNTGTVLNLEDTSPQQVTSETPQRANASTPEIPQTDPVVKGETVDDGLGAEQVNAPSKLNIDNATGETYNNIINNEKGGASNGTMGSYEDPGRGMAGLQGYMGTNDAEGANSFGRIAVPEIVRISGQLDTAYKQSGIVNHELKNSSADNAAFSAALNEARSADSANGWAVTPKTAEELTNGNVRTFMTVDNKAGFGVAPDGDIEAVFKNPNGGPVKALDTLIPAALENGGNKLDCYGEDLTRLYAKYGFVPVARVEFNPEYANPGWDSSKGAPYVYFMVHNGDSAAAVVSGKNNYKRWADEELAALPTYGKNDYDAAYAYRDGLIKNRGKNKESTENDAQSIFETLDEVVNGKEKATSQEAVSESTSVNDNPTQHTAAEQARIEEYKAAVDPELVEFYNNAKSQKEAKKGAKAYTLKPVSSRAASDIKAKTGVDVSGYKTVLDVKQANHIYTDHGEHGKSDRSMSDANDVGRIQYVLDNYDDVVEWGRTKAYSEPNGRGGNRTARTVKFSKKVNGTYYVVEAVPDTNAKTVYVVSAYMLAPGKVDAVGNAAKNKTGETQQSTDAQMPQRHGRTGSIDVSPAINNVAQTGSVVNSEAVDDGLGAEQADIYGKSVGAATLAGGPMVETQAKALTKNRFLPNEAKETLDIAKHERVSNAMQFARATGRLMTDTSGNIVYFNEQVDDILSIESWDGADRDVAMLLAKEAWNKGDKETWRTLTERIVKANTGFAQGLQGNQKWIGTPQHKVNQAVEAVNKQNEAKKNKANKTAVAKKARTIKDTVSKQAKKAAQEALDFLGEKEGVVKRIFNSSAKDLKLQMQKLITQSWENKQAVHDQLVKFIIGKYGFVDADAENAANLISAEFYDRLATESAKELDRRFTPRNSKKKSYSDRFKELFNLGAFNDEFFTKLATERLYGEAISLSVKEAEQIYSLMDSALKETDPYMRSLYEYKANEIVASKMPKPLAKKIFTALYDSMLGNLRTTVSRNAGGNIGFAAVEQTLRKANTAAVDWATSKVTGERYYAMPSTDYYRAYGKGLKKGAVETVKDFGNKAHTNRSGETKSEFVNETTPFDNRILAEIDRVVGALLEIGDRPFYEAQYAARMQELTALRDANKLSPQQAETFDEWASGYAKLDALEAVFQNDSNMAKAFAGLKEGVSQFVQGATGVAGIGGQAAIPFTKTPGNLIENAIDYMPVIGEAKNAVQTLVEAKKGEFNQARFAKQTGRNLAGLEVAALLYAPIAAGLVTGGGDDREDKEQLETSGWQEYSIKIGDSYYSYDWIPVLGPLMASLADFHEAREYGDASLLEAGMSGLQTTFEQSALQGFNRLFGGYSGNMVEGFADSLLGISSQAIPSLMRQAARATDEYERETYDPNTIKSQLNYVMNGVPGLRETLPVKTDIYGEPMLVSDGGDIADRLIENLLSPAYRSNVNADAVNDELLRLGNTGNAVNIPTVDKFYDINKDGRNEQLTTEQYTTFKETRGQKLHGVMESIINTEGYEELPDNIKSDALSKAVELASTAAREELITNAGGEYKHDYEDELKLSDSDLGAYLVYKTTFNDAEKSEGSDFIDELLDGFNKQSKAVIDTLMEVQGFENVASAHDAGISSEKYYDLKELHDDIDNVNDFAAAVDQGKGAAKGLTDRQKEWAKDNLTYGYYIPTPAEESRYTSLTEDQGLSSETAQNVIHAIDALEPPEGKDSVQLWQKYDAIAEMDATDTEKLKAIKAYTSTDKAFEKIVLAYANGCTLEQIAVYKRLQSAFSKVGEQDAYYYLLGLTQSEYSKLKSYLK